MIIEICIYIVYIVLFALDTVLGLAVFYFSILLYAASFHTLMLDDVQPLTVSCNAFHNNTAVRLM